MTWPVLKYWGLFISDLLWIDMFLGKKFLEEPPLHSFGEEFFKILLELLLGVLNVDYLQTHL